ADDGADETRWRHLADAVAIDDQDVAAGIDCHRARADSGAGGGPAVAAEARNAVAGNGADDTRGRHLADDVAAGIGDEAVAVGFGTEEAQEMRASPVLGVHDLLGRPSRRQVACSYGNSREGRVGAGVRVVLHVDEGLERRYVAE